MATLANRIVVAPLTLANFKTVEGVLCGIDLRDQALTEHFLSMMLYRAGKWFCLAKYLVPWCEVHGPAKLAEFLDLGVNKVFPISYNIYRMWP